MFPGIPFVESPLFCAIIDELELSSEERRIATELHERGYAVIDFPDDKIEDRIERIRSHLEPRFAIDFANPHSTKSAGQRLQDGWVYSEDIRAIACNASILRLLGKVYGRKAFPFQTLNFPVGTAQHLHSDSIHFSSIPERFMCGVWLAMEDVDADSGPLTYLPGSHKWPILSNAMIGRRGSDGWRETTQEPFETAWEALVEHSGLRQETFLARKGQALIWAANLLHGGSLRNDPTRTRWSQVTHYYFEDCIYYTPAFSDEPLGRLDLRSIVDVESEEPVPNSYLGEAIGSGHERQSKQSLVRWIRKRLTAPSGLPRDFDPVAYYRLNPDIAITKVDPASHYLANGKAEGRRYRYRSG
jgi:hypothetical protein